MSTKHGGSGGAIVNLSSAASRLGGAGETVPYAASKGAIDSLTFGLAQEVAAEGIRVNAVSPGVIDTEIQPPGRVERSGPLLPMKRVGQPEEVAEAILWLLSDAASYVSGAVLNVSGGALSAGSRQNRTARLATSATTAATVATQPGQPASRPGIARHDRADAAADVIERDIEPDRRRARLPRRHRDIARGAGSGT